MTTKEFVEAFKKHGSIRAVHRNMNISYRQARKLYLQAVQEQLMEAVPMGSKSRGEIKVPIVEGRIKALKTETLTVPKKGVKRYLFTCAQNNTEIFEPFWDNIKILASHYKADLHIARFTYIKSGLGARGDKAAVTDKEKAYGVRDLYWDQRIEPFLSDKRVEVAPGLVWCGEMNILPTAIRPLSGLETYTGRRSGMFPHVKIALESIASGRNEGTKFNYTTGTITKRNYIQRKAGLKAEFHHCYGALLVEVDKDGDWFVRQINGDSQGTIYDLDIQVKEGELTKGHRPEAITWGDIHHANIDPIMERLCWGKNGILDTLQPKEQHFHDVLDFRSKSHHEIKDPHLQFKRYMDLESNVEEEINQVGKFFDYAIKPWCEAFIIDSNHHNHLGRWLKEQNGLKDPQNVEFWLELQQRCYNCVSSGQKPIYLQEALGINYLIPEAKFLMEDESHIICHDANGGIECGMHGDLGPNGSRGHINGFVKMGRKANTGHTHQAAIRDGVYVAGTCSVLSPDWTRGPGAWSHSHVLTYKSGKRTIITCWNGKWRGK